MNENQEPAHMHVYRDNRQAKYWLEPQVRLEANSGFSGHELTRIRKIIESHREVFVGEVA